MSWSLQTLTEMSDEVPVHSARYGTVSYSNLCVEVCKAPSGACGIEVRKESRASDAEPGLLRD